MLPAGTVPGSWYRYQVLFSSMGKYEEYSGVSGSYYVRW